MNKKKAAHTDSIPTESELLGLIQPQRVPTGVIQMRNPRIRIAGKPMEIDDWYRGLANPKTIAWWREPLARGDWVVYLLRVPRPGRLAAFLEIVPKLTNAEYWRLLGSFWPDTETPNVNRAHWLALFTSKRGNRDQLMDAKEHAAFDCLPDPVQIYRGAHSKNARGMAWTTDPDQAAWFANRFGHGQMVFKITVPKRKILGYFNARNETEVVIDPRRIPIEILNWTQDEVTEAAERLTHRRRAENAALILSLGSADASSEITHPDYSIHPLYAPDPDPASSPLGA